MQFNISEEQIAKAQAICDKHFVECVLARDMGAEAAIRVLLILADILSIDYSIELDWAYMIVQNIRSIQDESLFLAQMHVLKEAKN